jgi:hypothetical protein
MRGTGGQSDQKKRNVRLRVPGLSGKILLPLKKLLKC